MRYILLSVTLALSFIGCSSTLTPAISEYTIFPSSFTDKSDKPLSEHTLTIASTKSIPSLASKNIFYLRESGESGIYLYSRWSDTPNVFIERSLNTQLQEKKVFISILPSTSTAHSDWILEANLDAFYHRFSADGNSQGFIDITYRLIDASTKRLISSKHFTIIVKAPSNDAKGGVYALTQATQNLSEQCSQWLITQVKQ
ncbi:MAG: ABC-type transport auxiliary lipoprotein family protein [Sulfuricurvum sp.]|nr:ABC-type transport auxiliary lipoprotein family protein [Sulfuricurvum sp.]